MGKAFVAIAVLAMLAAAVVAAAPFISQGETGDADHPEMIIGSEGSPYKILTGKSYSFSFGVNKYAFRSYAEVKMEVALGPSASTYTPVTIGGPVILLGGNGIGIRSTPSEGIYTLNVDVGDSAGTWTYILKVTVNDKQYIDGEEQGPVTQTYHFKACIQAVDTFTGTVELSTDPDTFTAADPQALTIPCGDPTVPLYAFVKLGDGTYVKDGYDFYAIGLPDGIGMMLAGEIAGKLAKYFLKNPLDGEFDVYAVDKDGARNVGHGAFPYHISLPDGGFLYGINGGELIPYSEQGYLVMKQTAHVRIDLEDADDEDLEYSVTCTVGGEKIQVAVTPVSGGGYAEIESGVFDGHTGIAQVEVHRGDCAAMIHVLCVGPVTSSGLMPSVSAY